MLANKLFRGLRTYKVVKKRTDQGPLPNMIQYCLYSDQGQPLSFWHDIPINLRGDVINCVVEVPKEKHGKFEVKKNIKNHPIMQDTRKNIFTNQLQLRFYAQFPLFNYGYIPQTWQQTLRKDINGLLGDDDPIDICDLTEATKKPGDIFRGKILGGFCLIDQGQIDWKLIVIDEAESKQRKINNIEDIDPRLISSIKKWFKIVKVFDGKKPNSIAYDQKVFNKQQTLEIIKKTRNQWVNLTTHQQLLVNQVRQKYYITKRAKQSIIQ